MDLLIVPSYSQKFYSGGCRYDKEKEFVRLRITRDSVVSAGVGQKVPRDCPVATVGVMESIM